VSAGNKSLRRKEGNLMSAANGDRRLSCKNSARKVHGGPEYSAKVRYEWKSIVRLQTQAALSFLAPATSRQGEKGDSDAVAAVAVFLEREVV
jgi:hypothetical protein